jgi:transposase
MSARSQAELYEEHLNKQLSKQLGAIPVLLPIFEALGLVETVNHYCPGRDTISHGVIALLLSVNRLMAPQPLYRVEDWVAQTILPDLLGVAPEQLYDVRLARTLDDLYPHLADIWATLIARAITVYDLDLSYFHYDITSVYFEGAYDDSEKISYGLSRDHRSDTKQLNLAVNVTGEAGIPILYQVLAGRTSDRSTPLDNLRALQAVLDRPELAARNRDFVLVSDQAMLDRQVVAAYHAKGIRWLGPLHADAPLHALLGAVSADELAAHPLPYRPRNQPAEEPPRYHGVLRQTRLEHAGVSFPVQVLVVHSDTKAKLDREAREKQLQRLLDRLTHIQQKLNTLRYKQPAYVHHQIQKALEGNPARRFVDVHLEGETGELVFTFTQDEEALAQAAALDGRYLLGTNAGDLTAAQMLERFKGQEIVERRFRTVKGPIQVRPLYLQSEERIESLLLLVMVALLAFSILELQCRRAGQPITARRVLLLFEPYAAVYHYFADGSVARRASELSPEQGQLLKLLRFPPPASYLRRPEVAQ